MIVIRMREDLIAVAAQHAPSKACVTAIGENRAQVLGGFNPVESLPGWIVLIHSKHDREWIIGIECDEIRRKYQIVYLEDVPWIRWIGKLGGKRPLIDGEIPSIGSVRRLRARQHATETIEARRSARVRADEARE